MSPSGRHDMYSPKLERLGITDKKTKYFVWKFFVAFWQKNLVLVNFFPDFFSFLILDGYSKLFCLQHALKCGK